MQIYVDSTYCAQELVHIPNPVYNRWYKLIQWEILMIVDSKILFTASFITLWVLVKV